MTKLKMILKKSMKAKALEAEQRLKKYSATIMFLLEEKQDIKFEIDS